MPRVKGREYRNAGTGFQVDAAQPDTGALIVRGRPIVYDTPTELWRDENGNPVYEVIASGALAGADTSDFIFNCEHQGRVYARSSNKSLTLTDADGGADMEAHLDRDDQGHRQLYNDIRDGRLTRMSFSFTVRENGWDFNEATNTITIRSIEKVYDVSAVAFAAYDQTSISARSAAFFEEFREKQLKERQKRRRAIAYAMTF